MKNAHLRFGWLTYVKVTEKTTTNIKLRLDRFIGELLPDPPRQAKAHLISVIGGDTQIAAIGAAISLGDRFMVEGPGVPPVRVSLERNAQIYKASIQVTGRKKPLRHLIGLSEELASGSSTATLGKTLIASSHAGICVVFSCPSSRDSRNAGVGELVRRRIENSSCDCARSGNRVQSGNDQGHQGTTLRLAQLGCRE